MKTILLAAAAAAALSATPALARPMTATDMHMLHRLDSPSVAPDGRRAIYSLSTTDMTANKRSKKPYLIDLSRPSAPAVPLGLTAGAHDATFGNDGAVWYLAPVAKQDQLFRMALGGKPVQVSTLKGDIGGFKLSKDGSRLLIFADRDLRCADLACASLPPKPKTGTARTYDQLFVRHWDSWAEPGVKSRLFGFPIVGGRVRGAGVPLTGTLVGDTPSKPFGDGSEIDLSADGKTAYFTMREAGRIESTSTNLDIFMSPADGSAPPVNLTATNQGTDTLPTLSPDGRTLAYVSMARAGYEADRQVIMLRDLASGQVHALTPGWDRSAGSLAWTRDGRALLVTAEDIMEQPLFRVDVATGAVTRLTTTGHVGSTLPLPGGGAVVTINSVMAPDDLYRVDDAGHLAQLTNVNQALLAQLDLVTFEKFSFRGANNDQVWGMKVKPARAPTSPGAKLPIAFLVHGGPQGSFGNSWSFRWNPRLFSAPGYAVVAVDFHGSTGYGQAFTDAIHNNWGGWPLEDLQKGLAFATANDASLDADRACALGGSYGGYMVNWIEGNWPDRFRCIVQHDGVFDARAMAYETEELWFDEWEHGGKTYYQDPAAFERWNPVNYVANWKTPQLVITSENDFRIPYTQGLAAFTALQRRGIPSRLVIYPDENHWVLKPKTSIQWYGEVFGWMNKWMGPGAR